MISCTEFIPLYSELFKYLEEIKGKDEVIKYWEHIADEEVEPRLGGRVEKDGLMGCWNYWNKNLNEEACDFDMICDVDNNFFEIRMYDCPSRGMLDKLDYMVPYHAYCDHCGLLYKRVVERHGLEMTNILPGQCEGAQCILTARKKK